MLDFKKELQKLADMVLAEVRRRMESEIGINYRAKPPRNTLKDSKLYESTNTKVVDSSIVFGIADYYTYVVGGREVGWGTPPPHGFIDGIIKWVKERNIIFKDKTQNETVWAIARSIAKRGIQGREFIGNGWKNGDPDYVLPFFEKLFEKWADEVYEDVCKELDVYLK